MVYKKKKWWKPWANTIAYYPLRTDFDDYSWNGRNLSWDKYIVTVWWIDCAYYSSNRSYYTWYSLNRTVRTISLWMNAYSSSWIWTLVHISKNRDVHLGSLAINLQNWGIGVADNYSYATWYYTVQSDTWYQVVWTQEWNVVKLYVNWEFVWENTSRPSEYVSPNGWCFGCQFDTSYKTNKYTGYLSEVILEDKARTAQEISDYYNLTKWNYGL